MHFMVSAVDYRDTLPNGTLRTRHDWLLVRSSTDSGRTWHDARVGPPFDWAVDRQFFVVDNSSSKYRGRVYITGHNAVYSNIDSTYQSGSELTLWRSLDSGKTWERPLIGLPREGATQTFNPWNPVVLSNGTVVFPVVEQQKLPTYDSLAIQLKVLRSTDGGESFQKANLVSSFSMNFSNRGQAWSDLPSVTASADPSQGPFRDRIYLAWFQQRRGAPKSAYDVVVAHSADSGKTWSAPLRVSENINVTDSANAQPNVMPTIAVNKDGVVALMWYDRRSDPRQIGYMPRVTASLDGGETWLPSVAISEQPMVFLAGERRLLNTTVNNAPGTGSRASTVGASTSWELWPNGGHTAGFVAGADGVFHAVWVDNRSGIDQLYSAPVTVSGTVTKGGSSDFASLEDVGNKVRLELSAAAYDDKARTIMYTGRLRNISTDTLKGSLKARLIKLESDWGIPSVARADNNVNGIGAVWDFTALVQGGVLPPNAATGVKTISFRLEGTEQVEKRIGNRFLPRSMLSFEARVFGTATTTQKSENK